MDKLKITCILIIYLLVYKEMEALVMGKKYIYANEKDIREVDKVLALAARVLQTDSVVITDRKSVPPVIGAALAGSLTAGAAGFGATGIGSMALLGKGAGTAAFGFGSTLVAPVAIVAGVSYLVFKNKKEKKLHNMRLARYKEAVEKQNIAIKKFMELDKKREENEKRLKDDLDLLKKENLN